MTSTMTLQQIQRLNALTANLAKAQRPARRPGSLKPRTLQWQVQLTHERALERPDSREAHEFVSSTGLADHSALCAFPGCDRPFDHLVHMREQPSALVDELIDATQAGQEALDQLVSDNRDDWYGDADPRPGLRPREPRIDPIRIPPAEVHGMKQVAPGIYARVRVLKDPDDLGTRESELDFISPHRASSRPRVARCERCKHGTISHGTCTQCSHEQGVKTRMASTLPHLEFTAYA